VWANLQGNSTHRSQSLFDPLGPLGCISPNMAQREKNKFKRFLKIVATLDELGSKVAVEILL
jgi:hypothetical protein